MRVLIATQTLDLSDPHLGFFHGWVVEFAKNCEEVLVVCLEEGAHTLPKNVKVLSLGKERGKAPSFVFAWRLLRIVMAQRNAYDSVFVHMNPEYLVVCGLLWKMWHKRTALWYAHKSRTMKLRGALLFTDIVFSVTNDSFPITTPKLRAVGHGIDTKVFIPQQRTPADHMRLISVARIAESKHEKEMLLVVEELIARGVKPILTVVGEAGTAEEKVYKQELISEISKRGLSRAVVMHGPARHDTLPSLFAGQDVFLNFGSTGNMDKAGFEPLASGLPLITTNEAFRSVLSPYGLYVDRTDVQGIVDAVLRAKSLPMEPLVAYVQENHSLQKLVPKIVAALV